MGEVTLSFSGSDLIQLAFVAAGFIWGYASLNARVRSMEEQRDEHAQKIDQIGPLMAKLEALEKSVNLEMKHMREDLRDLARALRSFVPQAVDQLPRR